MFVGRGELEGSGDRLERRTKGPALTPYQKSLLDSYFYEHNIKLTKKNLRIVSKDLKIPHRRIVEYVNSKQRNNREAAYEEHMQMVEVLNSLNMQIQAAWKRFRKS